MIDKINESSFKERLWPSPGFFLATLLIVPAITVLLIPFAVNGSVFIGFGIYALIALTFTSTTKKISVEDGTFNAGRAVIATDKLGKVEALDPVAYRQEIGRKLDARAYLVMSGWVKTGVKIEILDAEDPTPYWIVSTRKPAELKNALLKGKEA